jgi:hypothetical protein
MRAWITALGLAASIPLAGIAKAADYYVSSNGDDKAQGSQLAPWKTITYAATRATAGDVVHVLPGSYPGVIATRSSGTMQARIRYVSDVRWGAKIDGGSAEIVWTNSGVYVDIVGFDVTGLGRLGILNDASNVRIVNNHVHDLPAQNTGSNGGAGIDNGNYSASDSDMIANVVHDIGMGKSSTVHGLYHSNLRGRIYNNIAYRNAGWGIHTWHNPKDVVIANNLVFENGAGGIIVGAGDSPGTGVADGFIVENNIVINNRARGIIEYGATGPNNTYLNNLLFNNDVGPYMILTGHPPTGTLTVDPMLVSYMSDGSGDYHLAPLSPCIDHGLSSNAPLDDLDGVTRPIGAGWDIGPYEWGAPRDGGAESGKDANPLADGNVVAESDVASTLESSVEIGPDAVSADATDESHRPPSNSTGDDGGCGCHMAARRKPPFMSLVVVALVLALLRSRGKAWQL